MKISLLSALSGKKSINPISMRNPSQIIYPFLGTALACSSITFAAELAPPPYQIIDRHGVNMATGHVSPSLTDVSIGGNLGLSHSISTLTSNFVNWEGEGPLGFREKYRGGVTKSVHHKPNNSPFPGDWVYVMRAFDDTSSASFKINPDGTTFTAYNDPRHTLEFRPGQGFIWIKADGTEVNFNTTLQSYDARAKTPNDVPNIYISQIKYPNGFTISISGGDPVLSVNTNTGYQLKYIYILNTAPIQNDVSNTFIPASAPENWSRTVSPKYIVAINNSVDYCPIYTKSVYTSIDDACPGLTQNWPKATYTWPDGMPRVMYIRETSFKVTDAMGAVTEFVHRPYTSYPVQSNPDIYVPRLVAIKSSKSNVPVITYDYKTISIPVSSTSLYTIFNAGPIAQLKSSTIGSDTIGYTIGSQGQYPGLYVNGSGGTRAINRVNHNATYGIYEVSAWDQSIYLEQQISNRVTSVYRNFGGGSTTFSYDTRGNITQISENGIIKTAGYETSCTPFNRKYCNQAKWMRDGNQNQTDFEYDPNSGQPTRIRYPANRDGIRAETRYQYTPKYAYYKNASGAFTQAATPIYLLTREAKCQTSATTADGSGCAAGVNDEVVTEYDYGLAQGPNNLSLRGITVTATNNGLREVRRTCYSYDVYGNRIGETKPNAGLSSCY